MIEKETVPWPKCSNPALRCNLPIGSLPRTGRWDGSARRPLSRLRAGARQDPTELPFNATLDEALVNDQLRRQGGKAKRRPG